MRHSGALDEELRKVVDHADALLQALVDNGDATLDALRERVSASIASAKARLDDLAADAERASAGAAESWERWINENPWAMVAIGTSLGFIVGWALASRRPRGASSTDAPRS